MGEHYLADAQRLVTEGIDALVAAANASASDVELLSVLTLSETLTRRLDRLTVSAIADLQRRGSFAEHGYNTPAAALCDLLGWERFEARRRVVAAEEVCDRNGLDGTSLPARLPTTAGVFTAGRCTLRHVEVIASVLSSSAAARLSAQVWAGVEAELAGKASCYTPSELRGYATSLVERLDQDGPAPDDREPEPVNELHLRRHRDGAGGSLRGRFEDAVLFDAIATLIDAKSTPADKDDDRSTAQRHAEALAEVCGYVLDHGDVGDCGGRRPHLNVLISLEELERRARMAMLDFGGGMSPQALRLLACDAPVIPIVLDGTGQPLDVGRVTRTIPDGLRRAVAARDRGCAHPGCGRTVSWCHVHHIKPWEEGGETALHNCVMLCRYHHRLLHRDSGWQVRIRDGLPEFVPPAWIDPKQVPRRRPPLLLIA